MIDPNLPNQIHAEGEAKLRAVVAALTKERDEWKRTYNELFAAINDDGSLTEHTEGVDLARDGAAALKHLNGTFARIAALTKERDEAKSEAYRQRELWGTKCNELADANERIAALEKALKALVHWCQPPENEYEDQSKSWAEARAALAGGKETTCTPA